ncbi:hypothetical protein [Chryseobacterium sp. RR2-3-20]|uniref:hypothetical protein n=1 Tax=Chryseobacterium sp. RR2-3-20 TaxID=2787626 RepID=UPI001ADEC88C|nr:hypothetical protein [Chryseobacterium sp. RR2-3-20]
MDKAIGGYFGLELSPKEDYLFKDFVHLNTARNCFEHILKVSNFSNVYLPYYTCEVMLEPLHKLNIAFEFYDVDDHLEPLFDFEKMPENTAFLMTNYFGLKTNFIKNLSTKIPNMIVDNAQALFAQITDCIGSFYSPRKFIGIADGGLLSCNNNLDLHFEQDYSYERMAHLLKRIDLSAEEGYFDFSKNDKSLENQAIKQMSNISKSILASVNFEEVAKKRKENFAILDQNLSFKNGLKISLDSSDVPMVYPFRTKNAKKIKEKLISEKIYCATYWPNVLNWCDKDKNSYHLTNEIIALPIDQRYTEQDMKKTLTLIQTNI